MGNLVSCTFNVVFNIRWIYVHDGISSSLIDSFHSPSTRPTGLTFDGVNLISGDGTAPRKIYVHIGVAYPWSDSFATECASSPDLAYDGADLISAFGYVHDIICVHVGISATIAREFATPASSMSGITYDGTNLISVDSGTDTIYIHDGISSTINSSFASPAGSPRGLAMAEGDLISCDSASDTVYVHDGVSASIKRTFHFGDLRGLTYATNNPPEKPTALLTQDETNPTDLTTITPYFSAIYNDLDTGDIAQNYQIQVNTASDFTGTSMWDTGKTSMADVIEGNRCPNVTYAGTTLVEGTTYYWRIRFWDDDDAQGAWSDPANFRAIFSPTAPTDLRLAQCPEEFNPIEIKEGKPRFSAIFNDPNSGDIADHYQVQVNTNSSFTGTEMWNSGKTSMDDLDEGERCDEIVYQGREISEDGSTYYWRIKFWDDEGHEGVWCDPGIFTMSGVKRRDSLLPITSTTRSLSLGREIILPSDD